MKVLYILPSYDLYGGTPRKTLDLMKYLGNQSSLYVYQDSYPEFKHEFEKTGGSVHEGFYSRNLVKHIRYLIKIIDDNNIEIVQTQFSMGETLGYILKIIRPKIKLLITFEGALSPSFFKMMLVNQFYKKADAFVYISNYVKSEKLRQFPVLKEKYGEIIYNGTELRIDNDRDVTHLKKYSILAVSGLISCKNIGIVIEALNLLINYRGRRDIYFYVAGDGPERGNLENLINNYRLQGHVFLLSYQSNVGRLLSSCDVFVHPSYAEGFGIVVAEAMLAEKPIIAANAGALPELIENEVSGLIVDPFDSKAWAKAIIDLIGNPAKAHRLSSEARKRGNDLFSLNPFYKNYENMYNNLLNKFA